MMNELMGKAERARGCASLVSLCFVLGMPVQAWSQGLFPFPPAAAQSPAGTPKSPTITPTPVVNGPVDAGLAPPAVSLRPPSPPEREPGKTQPTAVVAGVKVARPTEANTQVVPGVVLRFENADINDIVQAVLGDILRLNYLVDPSLQARITLQTAGNISAADVYNILESVLALHGIAIVRDGKLYKVVRDVQANREAATTAVGEQSPVAQVIPLKFVQASGLVGVLKGMLGPQALIVADPTNRHLIVVDRAQNVGKVLEMTSALDVDYLAKVRIRLIEVTKGDATELAREMDTLFRTSGLFNWPGTEGNKVYFLPVTRMNAILVAAANDAMLEAAEKWIRTLDDEPKSGMGASVHVYPVANSNAAHLANLLRQLYGGAAAPGTTNQAIQQTSSPGLGATAAQQAATDPSRVVLRGATGGALAGNVQVIADESTNSLVIRASPQDYLQIKRIIERIDIVPRQVLIQVMVAEVELNDSLQYGVEWWLKNLKVSGGGKQWSAQAGLDTGLNSPGVNVNPTTPKSSEGAGGFNYLILNKAGDITGLFNLLASNTDLNVLSAPHVLASDGKVAKVEIGSEEPIVTQTVMTPTTTSGTLTNTTSNNVTYRPTGILMEVKPSINASGLVTLNLTQEVSSRGGEVTVGGVNYPSFQKRKVSTDVTIEEGKTLVVAGLIQDRGTKANQGVPGLKDIPFLGGLFGTQNNASKKSELLIAITPYVIRDKSQGEYITQSLRDSLKELKSRVDVTRLNFVPPATAGEKKPPPESAP